jgi:hypothetical protein
LEQIPDVEVENLLTYNSFTHEPRYLIDKDVITLGISVQGAIYTWTVSVEGCCMWISA